MMRGKLKQKEKLVTENDFLKAELEELKQKY
jgi:cell shape-determining protein MreC